jgi:hypothetical protein
MTKNIIMRFLLVSAIALLALFDMTSSVDAKRTFKSYVFSDFDIERDAKDGILKVLNQGEKPYIVRRIYEISDAGTISITTKTHFAGYRQKPTYRKEVFNTNNYTLANEVGSKIEFVYNKATDKDHITEINKKRKADKNKKIALNGSIESNSIELKHGHQRIS